MDFVPLVCQFCQTTTPPTIVVKQDTNQIPFVYSPEIDSFNKERAVQFYFLQRTVSNELPHKIVETS